MRIRTIKPEFWTHPVMLKLENGAKLLAIGLLNLADDEGFFIADPDIVRGAIMPKEDSLNVHGWLSELSRIGYIEMREHSELGLIGFIVKFAANQRVNRPNPSKLKPYFSKASKEFTEDSLSNQGELNEDSPPEEEEEGNRKGRESPHSPPSGGNPEKLKRVLKIFNPNADGNRKLTKGERTAWNSAKKEITDDDLAAIERFYKEPKSERANQTWNRKTGPAQLLNQWSAQVDFAKAYFAKPNQPSLNYTTVDPETGEEEW